MIGPRHYYEIRSPKGERLGYGLIPESWFGDPTHVPAMMSQYPEGSTFRSQFVTAEEVGTVIEEMIIGDWSDVQTGWTP